MQLMEVLSQVRHPKNRIGCLKNWKRTIIKHYLRDPLEEGKVESWSWIEFRP